MLTTSSSHKGRSSTLFAFTPRQVLLSKNNHTMGLSADNGTLTLKRQQKHLLHQSIALYLHHCGFSKTLKRFRSEAQIEKDDLEGSTFDLEEMCLKYLEVSGKNAKSNIKDQKEEDVHSKNKEEGKSKEKKKKKSKSVSESDNVEDNQLESSTLVTENRVKLDVCTDAKVNGAETEKRSKDKVKKKDKPSSNDGDAKEQTGDPNEIASEKGNLKDSNNEVIQEKKKDSKKRKISEENGQQTTDIKADGGTKRRKLEESKGGEQSAKTNGDISISLNSNGKTYGNLENTEDKSSVQRSQKKQEKGSVEPKSAKTAFQRVQADKVEFADERLQDNSYWAKDGADSGYGAKAQEILGQVRGRDFRHEKTKKKRGTYRGGQIDLQSHSVKFNYSDED